MVARAMAWSRRSIGRSLKRRWWRALGGRAGLDGRRRRPDLGRPAARGADTLDRGAVEDLPHDLRRLYVVDGRARLDDQPVRECRLSERLDVIRDDVIATEQAGQRLARAVQRDRAAR